MCDGTGQDEVGGSSKLFELHTPSVVRVCCLLLRQTAVVLVERWIGEPGDTSCVAVTRCVSVLCQLTALAVRLGGDVCCRVVHLGTAGFDVRTCSKSCGRLGSRTDSESVAVMFWVSARSWVCARFR